MAGLGDLFKRNLTTVLVVGVGVAVLAPAVWPAVARALKPAAKGVVKSGIALYERGLQSFAELGEVAEDIVAEARAEITEEAEALAAATAAAAASNDPSRPAADNPAESRQRTATGAAAPTSA